MSTSEAPFTFTEESTVSILTLRSQLNNVQWGDIDSIGSEVLSSLEQRPNPNVIVDLSHLNYMGSAMVALIVRIWKATTAKKGKLSVVCPHAGVLEVFRLASLDKQFSIVPTEPQARGVVGASGGVRAPAAKKTDGSSNSTAAWVAIPLVLLLVAAVATFLINPGLFGFAPNVPAVEEETDTSEEDEAEADPELGSAGGFPEVLEMDEPSADPEEATAPAADTTEFKEQPESPNATPSPEDKPQETTPNTDTPKPDEPTKSPDTEGSQTDDD